MTDSQTKKPRVVVAMSGGVDSSVCAYLLAQRGYEVIGVTIRTWSSGECRDERSKGCCSIRDIDDARSVARCLGITHYVLDLSEDFREKVIQPFVEEYFAGRTPNPCIECNRHIKFGILLEKADELEADWIATGHYARKGYDESQRRHFVREAVDASKDQSYVLFGQTQEQLARTLLPIGELKKTEVRALAGEIGLRVAEKPDSQEICFVRAKYGDFLKENSSARLPGEGAFVDREGLVLGSHEGYHLYTIGQSKRVPIGPAGRRFVTAIDPAANRVTLGPEEDLLSQATQIGRLNWQLEPRTGACLVKIRSRHEKTAAEIVRVDGTCAVVRFNDAQKAVTPGQAAVFYDGGRILGGGWIEESQVSPV